MNNIFKGKHGPLLIAEIGGNHEGDFEYAKELTRLAIDTDVDFIKFQIYSGNTLVSQLESPDRNQHFKKFELSKEQHLELAKMVIDAGINYTSSIWDFSAIEWLDDYMELYKIGSGDLTAYPLLKKIASIGKPIILSTGLSSDDEVLETVEFIRKVNPIYENKEMFALLQCTSMYPIKPSDANLLVMNSLRDKSNLTIGYSDHTEGSKALYYATAMGAEVLEFHFTDTRSNKNFRDHMVSLTPDEVLSLIEEIKLIKSLQGSHIKEALPIEINNNHHISFRRAVYPVRDIMEGELINENDLTILRPLHGIDARSFESLIGKKINRNVKKHEKLSFDFFQP